MASLTRPFDDFEELVLKALTLGLLTIWSVNSLVSKGLSMSFFFAYWMDATFCIHNPKEFDGLSKNTMESLYMLKLIYGLIDYTSFRSIE